MVLGLKPMEKLITCDNYLGIRQNQGLILRPGPWTRLLGEIDALASLWVSDRTMAHHGLLESFVLKLTFSNGRTVCNMKCIVVCSAVPI